MKWAVILAALVGAFVLGLTAIDTYDEQRCKDRYATSVSRLSTFAQQAIFASGGLKSEEGAEVAEKLIGPEPECDGFLPW